MKVLNSADVASAYAEQPLWLLDELNAWDLRTATSPQQAFERAGFAIHYWRPAAPASMVGSVEMVFEHTTSGLWFAAAVEMREQHLASDALANLERALSVPSPGPASMSLTALTQSVATAASQEQGEKMGEAWSLGGLLLGCLRVVEQTTPADLDATRMLVALVDPALHGQLDRLACWQAHADTDRHAFGGLAEQAYVRAIASLWPRYARVADTAASDIKPDRLMSYPREDWPTAAPQIVLDAVANQQAYVIRPLQAAWEQDRFTALGLTGKPFTAQGLLDMAIVPDGVQVTPLT